MRMVGRGGRSRSYLLVRNSHLGILWKDRRTHGVRLSTKDFSISAVGMYTDKKIKHQNPYITHVIVKAATM